jgi:guanylate kinase
MNMLLIIIGSSGSGKNTLAKELEKLYKREITTTTRKIRIADGEKEGIDYNYITKDEFLSILNNNGFIETDEVSDEYYGTEKEILKNIEEVNKLIILTASGASKLQKYCKKNKIEHLVFLLKLPKAKIKERLILRGDTPENIKKRLKKDNIVEKAEELEEKKELKINFKIDTSYMKIKDVKELILKYIKKSKNQTKNSTKIKEKAKTIKTP